VPIHLAPAKRIRRELFSEAKPDFRQAPRVHVPHRQVSRLSHSTDALRVTSVKFMIEKGIQCRRLATNDGATGGSAAVAMTLE